MTTSLGMGYQFSEMSRRISSANESNIVTRLASRSITGHELPIQVHQHYGLELPLILHPETCIRRAFATNLKAQTACSQLEKSALQGLYSCIYDDRRVLSVDDKVEKRLIAKPVTPFREVSNCPLCDPQTEEGVVRLPWEQKAYQDSVKKQSDVCCCRQIVDYYDLIG